MKNFIRLNLLIAVFIQLAFIVSAQDLTQTLSGQVVDAVTSQPIIGANIIVLDSEPLLGGTTDLDGRFRIENIPVGRQDVEVSYIGYETVLKSGLLLTSAKVYELEINMQESMNELGTVTVSAGSDKRALNEMAKVSARSFSIEESGRFAGGLSDPARVAYHFPGVTFSAPQDNGVVVRGNTPTNVLWKIEGVEVPGAAHFGGGNLAGAGLISIYSAQVLGTSDFFASAFPAEYGNATAGIFDINFRRGTIEKNKFTAQIGVLGADVAAEGPLKKGGQSSYLINYRHGFIGYYGKWAGGAEPYFQDLSYKLYLPTEKAGTFSIWGIGGLSSIFTPYRKYEVEGDEIKRRETDGDFEQDDIDFDMAATGINHKINLTEKTFLNSSLAVSTNGYFSKTDWFTPDADTLNTGSLTPYTDAKNREIRYTATTNLTHKFNRRWSNTSGIVADYLTFNTIARQADRPLDPLTEHLNTTGNTYFVQAYTQSAFQASEKISIQAGVNVSHFGVNDETTFEPRAGLKWQATNQLSLGFGYGRHSRREELKNYFYEYNIDDRIVNNENIKRTKADHYVASFNWDINKYFRFNVEAYYQRLFDVPVIENSSFSFINYTQIWQLDAPLNNSGTGINKGIDFSLEHSFHNNFYFLLTSSIFDSKYTGADGVERNTLFDRGWQNTLAAGKEFTIHRKKKNRVNLLGFNVSMTYMGGLRVTPFLEEESVAAQRAILDETQMFSEQNDPELWVNAGITYKINKEKNTTTWGLDFQNATLAEQVQGYEYNYFTREVQQERVLFLIPNFYYKIEF